MKAFTKCRILGANLVDGFIDVFGKAPMKYSLRSLMIVALVGPPLLALAIASLPRILEKMVTPKAVPATPATSFVPPSGSQIARTVVENLSAEKKSGRLKGFNIEVDVQGAKVLLTGRISSEEQRDHVTATVSRVKGVKRVVNRLAINLPNSSAPARNPLKP